MQLAQKIAIIGAAVVGGLLVLAGVASTLDAREIDGKTVNVTAGNTAEPLVNFELPSGAVAIGTLSGGLKNKFGADKVYPTASIAKVITSLVVLDAKPITDGAGPAITMTAGDVALWQQTVAAGGSNLTVADGLVLTERQMLDGVMLVSANNLADSLVFWAYGSFSGYQTAATRWLANNSLNDTKIGSDASGLDPGTVSTLGDLFKIGQLAMRNDTLRAIAGQRTADFPGVGLIENTNKLLADPGFIGIKTGHIDEVGYNLLVAYQYGAEIIIGIVLNTATPAERDDTARRLVNFAVSNLGEAKLPAGSVVGRYELPWGGSVDVVTADELSGMVWAGEALQPDVKINSIEVPNYKRAVVGEITLGDQKSDLVLAQAATKPGLIWKIFNLDKLK